MNQAVLSVTLHEFHAEKKHAFEALASQIDHIVNPQENVVTLRATK